MAAASYTTDLADIITDPANTTGWTLISSGGGGANSFTVPETDDYVQGTQCISRSPWSSSIRGMVYNSAQTVAAGEAVWIWWKADVAQALAAKASGGIQALIGSGTGALNAWYVDGSDTYTFGGWKCVPIDPTVAASTQIGSPTSTTSFFGVRWNVPSAGPSKGFPFKIDAIRHGRALTITGGDLANGYGTFQAAADFQSDITRQWGQLQFGNGVYLMQGLLQLGTSGTAVDFRDSNRVVFVANTEYVASTFNGIEVDNASSRVDWTNVSISALGTVSKGYFNTLANADVNLDACTFTDMDTFVFQSAGSVVDSTFRRCGQIILGGATMSGCLITRSTAATALLAGSSVSTLSNTSFVSAGTGHAIEITAAGTYTLNGISFSGYAATNGTTGNEAVYVNVASGSVTINSDSALSYRTAGATVTVVAGQKTLSVTNVVSGSDVVILAAGTSTVLASNDGATNPVTSFDYSYTYAPSTFVDIAVYLAGYVPYIVRNFLLPANGGSVQVAQVIDRNYTP